MNSKWGSLSSKKNLTFNYLLALLPDFLVKYVVYHEMIHLKVRPHNEGFWKLISTKFKYHQRYEKDLLVYWFLINKKKLANGAIS
jgi:predicted metal-dependent hydrolase